MILIAYRPTYTYNNCRRGCCGSTTINSDLKVYGGLTESEVADKVMALFLKADENDPDYEFSLWLATSQEQAGRVGVDGMGSMVGPDPYMDPLFLSGILNVAIENAKKAVQYRDESRRAEEEAAAKRAEDAEAARMAEESEEYDRNEYERLKAKFEMKYGS